MVVKEVGEERKTKKKTTEVETRLGGKTVGPPPKVINEKLFECDRDEESIADRSQTGETGETGEIKQNDTLSVVNFPFP